MVVQPSLKKRCDGRLPALETSHGLRAPVLCVLEAQAAAAAASTPQVARSVVPVMSVAKPVCERVNVPVTEDARALGRPRALSWGGRQEQEEQREEVKHFGGDEHVHEEHEECAARIQAVGPMGSDGMSSVFSEHSDVANQEHENSPAGRSAA